MEKAPTTKYPREKTFGSRGSPSKTQNFKLLNMKKAFSYNFVKTMTKHSGAGKSCDYISSDCIHPKNGVGIFTLIWPT